MNTRVAGVLGFAIVVLLFGGIAALMLGDGDGPTPNVSPTSTDLSPGATGSPFAFPSESVSPTVSPTAASTAQSTAGTSPTAAGTSSPQGSPTSGGSGQTSSPSPTATTAPTDGSTAQGTALTGPPFASLLGLLPLGAAAAGLRLLRVRKR